jgi:UDP-sugar transporter A1/2/3
MNAIASSIQLTYRTLSKQLVHWSPQSTLIAAGIPSLLYAIQGTLTYTAYQHLDPVTFNGMMQFKVLSSALGCYIVLGQKLSGVHVATLALLMMSTLIFQGSWKELLWDRWVTRRKEYSVEENSNGKRGCDTSSGQNKNNFWLGVLPCVGATLLSGLAGAFSQKSLQTSDVGSMMERDAYFYTVEISFLSAICLVISLTFHCWRDNVFEGKERNGLEDQVFFRHWNYSTLLPISTKASAGVLTALVHRHLGSVIKGFALVLGLVFSALLQFALEGRDLTAEQLVGTMLVLLSSWLHFKSPAK